MLILFGCFIMAIITGLIFYIMASRAHISKKICIFLFAIGFIYSFADYLTLTNLLGWWK